MNQLTLATGTFETFRKPTRREKFLAEMDRAVPWKELCAAIEPVYPKAGNGRPPIGLERMLRIYFLQHWFNLSDPGAEEALYDSRAMREFVGIDLGKEPVPDETTICKFRHLLERNTLGAKLFKEVSKFLQANGFKISNGTIVDATIIQSPSSTKNKDKARDPDAHQTRKGNQWYFGMKLHIGVDSKTKLIHSVVVTPANVHDSRVLPDLLHGEETRVWGDSAYAGQTEAIEEAAPKAADLAVAEHCSLSKAADALKVSKSTVSNRLAELESRLGTSLVIRGARGLVLTESGVAYHRHIKIRIDLTDEAESLVRAMSSGVAGEISLNVPPGLMQYWLAKPMEQFIRRHADIRMNIITTDRSLNGLGKDVDLGFHWGELPDSQLYARRIFHDEIIFVAGSEYVKSQKLDLKSADIEFLQLPKNYAGESQKRIAASGEAWWVYQMPSRVTVNSIEALVALQQKPFSMWCYAVTLNRPRVGSRVHRLIEAVVKAYSNH